MGEGWQGKIRKVDWYCVYDGVDINVEMMEKGHAEKYEEGDI